MFIFIKGEKAYVAAAHACNAFVLSVAASSLTGKVRVGPINGWEARDQAPEMPQGLKKVFRPIPRGGHHDGVRYASLELEPISCLVSLGALKFVQ